MFFQQLSTTTSSYFERWGRKKLKDATKVSHSSATYTDTPLFSFSHVVEGKKEGKHEKLIPNEEKEEN